MNNLDWFAQLLLTGVFVYDGLRRVFAYRRGAEPLDPGPGSAAIHLPIEWAPLVAVLEILGALSLWVPPNLWPPDVLPRLAAVVLALLAVSGSIYHMRRKESGAPGLALFLLALFVILSRMPL